MGLQVPRSVDTQIPKEGSIWGIAQGTGRDVSGTGIAEGE